MSLRSFRLEGGGAGDLARFLATCRFFGRWDIQSWILPEKAEWLEMKADILRRHHGPIFRPRQVMRSHRIPKHDVRIIDRTPLEDIARKPRPSGMLIGVMARGKFFIRIILRHPHVLRHETGPLGNRRFGMRKRTDVIPGHQLIRHRFAQFIQNGGIDDFPVSAIERVLSEP